MSHSIPDAIESFHGMAKTMPSTDAPDAIIRHAATMPHDVAITALARLFVLTHARKKHDHSYAQCVKENNRVKCP